MIRKRKKPYTPLYGKPNPETQNPAGDPNYSGNKGGGGSRGGFGSASSGVGSVAGGVGHATGTSGSGASAASTGVSSITSGVTQATSKPQAPAPTPTTSSPLSSVTTQALGLSKTEAGLVPYVLDAAAQSQVSPALLMGLIENQSEFKPSARLGAERGLGMFGPDSSRAYDVQHGDTPEAIKSQVDGLAAMLNDAEVNKDPINALNMWSRGDHQDFAEKVMAAAHKFRPLDEALNPQASPASIQKAVQAASAARDAAALGKTALAAIDMIPGVADQGPSPRKVATCLESAVAKSTPEITGLSNPAQTQFAAELAKQTGLSPRVVAAWVRQEGGNGTGDNNWLNIGWDGTTSQPIIRAPEWKDPVTAARATADWLKGTFGSQYDYSAANSITSILPNAVGKDDAQQIATITNSGWAGDPAYTENVTRNYNEVGASGSGQDVRPGLIRKARRTLGKPATKALLAGGQVVRDPKAGEDGQQRKLQVNELFYDPGISLDDSGNGLTEIAPIGGHSDHVHVSSTDPRSMLQAIAIAKRLGLNVSENPAVDQVDPVHTSGSFHYNSEQIPAGLGKLEKRAGASGNIVGQAIDVSGDPSAMSQFNQIIAARATGEAAPINVPVKGDSPLAVKPTAPTSTGTAIGGAGATLTGGGASSGGWTPMEFSKDGSAPPKPMVSTGDINVPNMASAVLPAGFGGDFSGLQGGGDISPEEQSLIDQLVAAAKPKSRLRTR